MNKVDRPAIIELSEHESTTNLSIITYLSVVGISKLDKETGYPTIEGYSTYCLYKYMNDNMKYIHQSSVRFAVKRLIEQGFLEYMDEEKTVLAVMNSGSGHMKSDEYFKSKGYITLHHFFFTKAFFDLPLKSKKLMLIIICRLNNSPSRSININFKSQKNPETYLYFCKIWFSLRE